MATLTSEVSHESHPLPHLPESRWLHPVAWWSWALGVAIAASTTTNPLLLGALMVAAALVVERRRPNTPWARSFGFFVKLAMIVVTIRVLAQILIGAPGGTTELLPLPGVELPDWLAGVRVAGTVMAEPLLAAFYDGLRLAAILIAVGAASSLASPTRLLKSVPAAVYEIGVSVVVAMTFLPQLVADLHRVRANRRLRGRSESGVRGFGAAAMPVLHGAMDRSITLAAAMDSRGYGRSGDRSVGERRWSAIALMGGSILLLVGLYGLLGTGTTTWWGPALIVAGVGCTLTSVAMAGRRSIRTRYRPNRWQAADIGTAACGLGVAGCFVVAGLLFPAEMNPSTSPAAWPNLPLLGIVGIVLTLAPAVFTPPPPRQP